MLSSSAPTESSLVSSSFGLADGNEIFLSSCGIRWIVPSSTNKGGQGWGVGQDVEMRVILLAIPI